MNQDNAGTPNPIAPESTSTTNQPPVTTSASPEAPPETPPVAPPQTETPPPAEVTPKVPSEKPKSSKGLITLVVILAILALAGTAFGIYGMFFQPKPTCETNCSEHNDDANSDSTIENNDVSSSGTSNAAIDSTEEVVRKIVNQLQESISKENLSPIKTYDMYVLNKNTSAKTLLPLEKSFGIYGTRTNTSLEDQNQIESLFRTKLTELGFVENNEIEGPFYLAGNGNYINKEKQIVCNISVGSPYSINCGHQSWISEDKIAFANQLAEAVYEASGSYPFSIDTNYEVTIKDSAINPYQRLNIPVGNAIGLFYRTSPNSEWKYFKAVQAAPECSEFNTADLKNAFAGEQCYEAATNQESTVQP